MGYRFGTKQTYAWVYWIGALFDFLLQIAVGGEIAAAVLQRGGRWVEGAKSAVLPFVIAAPVCAAVLAATMKPAAEAVLHALAARASLFTTVLICFLFTAVVRASQRLGLDWRSHIARESYGLTFWTGIGFFTDTLHAYWRTMGHFQMLEEIRVAAFQLALLDWCVAFWLPERAASALPAGLQFEALHPTRGYNLSERK